MINLFFAPKVKEKPRTFYIWGNENGPNIIVVDKEAPHYLNGKRIENSSIFYKEITASNLEEADKLFQKFKKEYNNVI